MYPYFGDTTLAFLWRSSSDGLEHTVHTRGVRGSIPCSATSNFASRNCRAGEQMNRRTVGKSEPAVNWSTDQLFWILRFNLIGLKASLSGLFYNSTRPPIFSGEFLPRRNWWSCRDAINRVSTFMGFCIYIPVNLSPHPNEGNSNVFYVVFFLSLRYCNQIDELLE